MPVGLLGFALAIVASVQLAVPIFMRSDELAQRRVAKFYLYSDTDLARSASSRLNQKESDPTTAAGIYLELVERDPASPHRWADLGEALALAGESQKGEQCYQRALQLGSNVPQILLDAGDSYVTAAKYRMALQYFGKILILISEYDAAVFSYFDNMGLSAQELREQGGLPTPRAVTAYLRHLLTLGESAGAKDLWNWTLQQGYADYRLAAEYVSFLLNHGLGKDAVTAWAGYAGDRSKGYLESTFVYNGDFESDPSGSRLDWRIEPSEHVRATRDLTMAHSGTSSLRLEFDGKDNTDFHHIFQELVLAPGAYELEAYVRTRDLSTDEGIGLRLASNEPGFAIDVTTEVVNGTTEWKRVSKSFSIANKTRLVMLQVRRRPSLRFDNQISGVAWVDSVAIKGLH